MYLYLGQETVVRSKDIVGIFDLENTSISRLTKSYLAGMQKQGRVIVVSPELPKSFVVCQRERGEQMIYLSQISSGTLKKRAGK